MEVAKVVEIHVGAGVERTQRPVQRQRAFGVTLFDALTYLHLHEVATRDQLFGFFNSRDVIGFGKVPLCRVSLAGFDDRGADRVLELFFQVAQPLFRAHVGLGRGGVGVDDQVELARQVVDDSQLFALQQQDIWRAQGVGRAGFFEFFLDVTHRVIAKIARQTAAKTRQTRAQGHFETLLILLNEVQRVAHGGFCHFTVAQHFGFGFSAETAGAQQSAGGQANEAVASKPFAAHHRFKQKTVFAVVLGVGQLQVKRQGGFQVRKGFQHEGNAVVALTGQAFEFKFGDHRLKPPKRSATSLEVLFIHPGAQSW